MGLSQLFRRKSKKNEQNKITSEKIEKGDSKIIESSIKSSGIDNKMIEVKERGLEKEEENFEFDDLKFEEGEKEEVAAIFAACLAGTGTNVKYKIKSIKKVDPDLEACAVIAASCYAGSRDNVKVKIKNIYRVK